MVAATPYGTVTNSEAIGRPKKLRQLCRSSHPSKTTSKTTHRRSQSKLSFEATLLWHGLKEPDIVFDAVHCCFENRERCCLVSHLLQFGVSNASGHADLEHLTRLQDAKALKLVHNIPDATKAKSPTKRRQIQELHHCTDASSAFTARSLAKSVS